MVVESPIQDPSLWDTPERNGLDLVRSFDHTLDVILLTFDAASLTDVVLWHCQDCLVLVRTFDKVYLGRLVPFVLGEVDRK